MIYLSFLDVSLIAVLIGSVAKRKATKMMPTPLKFQGLPHSGRIACR
jgi:hypothetical protein